MSHKRNTSRLPGRKLLTLHEKLRISLAANHPQEAILRCPSPRLPLTVHRPAESRLPASKCKCGAFCARLRAFCPQPMWAALGGINHFHEVLSNLVGSETGGQVGGARTQPIDLVYLENHCSASGRKGPIQLRVRQPRSGLRKNQWPRLMPFSTLTAGCSGTTPKGCLHHSPL